MKKALLLIDLQNDFCPGGALAVRGGDEVIDIANQAIAAAGDAGMAIVASQDWHPAAHLSFAANHSAATVGEVGELDGLPQIWWPVHCVQGQRGAAFHPRLNRHAINYVVQKGTQANIDSYSAFFDNGHRAKTALDHWLKHRQITHLAVMGLATDYCVKSTILDALELGYRVDVLADGCRGVNLHADDSRRALDEVRHRGAGIIALDDFLTACAVPRA